MKKGFINKILCLMMVMSLLAISTFSTGVNTYAASSCTINWNTVGQTIDGFGISGAFHQAGNLMNFPEPKRTEILNLLFSTTTGAGFSIVRNIVGDSGTWGNSTDGPTPSIEPSEGVWSWTGDEEQIWLMNQAKSYGVTTFMSTVWSPPAWMKSNNSVINGGTLRTDKYQAYADYLAEYCLGYKSRFGIDIYAISLANEPDFSGGYSSCNWTGQTFCDFIKNNLVPTWNAKSVPTKVMIAEPMNWGESMVTTSLNDPVAGPRVDIVAAHDYGLGTGILSTAKSKGKKIWETEVSNLSTNDASITDGLKWAKLCHDHMVTSQINAFNYWWGACYKTNVGESLIRMDLTNKVYYADKRLYTLGNFSRFVRPGWVRIDATASPVSGVYVSAYKDSATGKFAIVAVNNGTTDQSVTFNLSGFNATSVTPCRTSATENLATLSDIAVSGGAFTATVAKQSVTTYTATASGSATPTPTPTAGPTVTPTPTPTSGPTTTPASGSDDFTSGTLNSMWSWVREDSTHWSLTALPGSMRITSQTGDIYTTSNNAKNLLLQNATGDWTITTKMTYKPSANYQNAGLLVYQDDSNYVKMVREWNSGNKWQYGKEVGGTFTSTEVTDSVSGTTVYLKIVKSGNNYSGYYSADGTNYTQVGTTQSVSLTSPKIGLMAIGSTQGPPEINCDFDYFYKN